VAEGTDTLDAQTHIDFLNIRFPDVQMETLPSVHVDGVPEGSEATNMKTSIALALVALVSTGCATQEPAKHPVQVKESMIEGVPVPATAKPNPGSKPGREDLRLDGYSVVDMTFDELDAWYEQRMPKGQSWNGWTWEEPIPGRMYVTRSYCQPGRDGISVVIIREEGGNPPAILIAQDGSGSGCKS
jgi:hypothetical protein